MFTYGTISISTSFPRPVGPFKISNVLRISISTYVQLFQALPSSSGRAISVSALNERAKASDSFYQASKQKHGYETGSGDSTHTNNIAVSGTLYMTRMGEDVP